MALLLVQRSSASWSQRVDFYKKGSFVIAYHGPPAEIPLDKTKTNADIKGIT